MQGNTRRVALIIDTANNMAEALCIRLAQLDYRVAAILPVETGVHRRMETHSALHVKRCDVRDQTAVLQHIETVEQTLGPIAILVVDAGVSYDLITARGQRMAERGWGRIVDIAASVQIDADQQMESVRDRRRRQDAQALALQLGDRGVTVNTISPGHIGTPAGAEPTKQQAAGRLSLAEEIAGLAAYLLSDEGGVLNGANIAVNGGRRLA
ncbi:MAG TPA: SDR family oxidoreductase [Oxalicibacterium sp.]|nr:SDR family oxidoreductase [Oxalicibacterium sp.]